MLHNGFDIRIPCEEHFKNTISETCSDCIQIPLFNQLPDGNLIKPTKEFYIILLTTYTIIQIKISKKLNQLVWI